MLEKKQTKKIEEILTAIDLEQPAPAEEPMRQYYFMEKARRLVKSTGGNPGTSADLSCHNLWLPDERKGFGETDRNSGADWICGRGRRESGRFCDLQYLYGA